MKVFILTEGGKKIGFGHIVRCLSLCQAFQEKGINPEFLVNGDTSISSVLKGQKYTLFNWPEKENKVHALLRGADIIIIDSYLAKKNVYKRLSELARVPVFLDDNKRLNYPEGVVVNCGAHAESLDYAGTKEARYLLGSRYAFLRRAFLDNRNKKIWQNLRSIMITFGGDDKRNMTPKILRFLENKYPMAVKNVIVSAGFQNLREINKLKNKKINLIHNPDAGKMKEVMLESDLAISAGGQTLHELASTGTPAVGITVARNQLLHAKGLARTGFLKYIGHYSDKDILRKLDSAIKGLNGRNSRKKRSVAGKRLIDGKGSQRVVKALLSAYYKRALSVRIAEPGDALDTYRLSSEEMVRKVSFRPQKFTWQHHLKWFRERLKDDSCVFFIFDTPEKFAGQLRFKLSSNQEEATISISLVKAMRELGLSSFLLNKSINELLKFHKNVRLIKAYVRGWNTRSVKSFERAEFRFSRDTKIGESWARLYIRKAGLNGG